MVYNHIVCNNRPYDFMILIQTQCTSEQQRQKKRTFDMRTFKYVISENKDIIIIIVIAPL